MCSTVTMNLTMSSHKKAFTLIEMMIVIAIIAILATLAIANFAGSIQKSRDGRRKSDLASIQKALELYYGDSNTYPATMPAVGYCWYAGGSGSTCAANTSIYMVKYPGDPKTGSAYTYCGVSGNYQIYATLENKNDPQIIPVASLNYQCGASPPCVIGATSYCYAVSSPNIRP